MRFIRPTLALLALSTWTAFGADAKKAAPEANDPVKILRVVVRDACEENTR